MYIFLFAVLFGIAMGCNHACTLIHVLCPSAYVQVQNLRNVLLLISLAHELRAWLLHYSPVVLYGVLPDMFYQHHLLLVEAIFLLLQDAVKDGDVKQSLRILQHYCFMFGPLYGMCTLIALLLLACFTVRFITLFKVQFSTHLIGQRSPDQQ